MKACFKFVMVSFLLMGSVPAFCQSGTTEITDPIKYNDYIVGQQLNIGTQLTALFTLFQTPPEEKANLVAELNRISGVINDCISNVNNLKRMPNENGLAQSAINLFGFYKKTVDIYYLQVVDILYSDVPDIDEFNAIVAKIQSEEAVFDKDFSDKEQAFAKYYGFTLE